METEGCICVSAIDESIQMGPASAAETSVPAWSYRRALKRAFDVGVSATILLITLPALIIVSLLVRRSLGAGVLYTQRRVGQGGEPFRIYKFRTMHHDRRQRQMNIPGGVDRRTSHKSHEDPRHTNLGRTLRRFSIDELPQLVNVVRGEMSLVGPRPEIFDVAQKRGYVEHPRHRVRPGMTGPYQVSELRSNGDLRSGFELDTKYVEEVTFRSDLRYLMQTVAVMAGGSGEV